jgi:hypothetical protein
MNLIFIVQSCWLEHKVEIQSRQPDTKIVIMKHIALVFD